MHRSAISIPLFCFFPKPWNTSSFYLQPWHQHFIKVPQSVTTETPSKDFLQINTMRKVFGVKMPLSTNLTLGNSEIILGQPFKNFSLSDRSRRENFYRTRKLFPSQTFSKSYTIWEDRWMEYSGKQKKKKKSRNLRFKGSSKEQSAATTQRLSCSEEFISSNPVPDDFFLCWQCLQFIYIKCSPGGEA